MKPFLTVMLSIAAIYGFVKLGKYLGRKTTPPYWEPANNEDDQSKNLFV